MIKLLLIATIPGTLSGFLTPFAHHFRQKGLQVDAMAHGISDEAECLAAFDEVWDVEWSRNPLDPRNLLVAMPRICEVVAQNRYDIVHVHTPVAAFVTRYALKDLRKQLKLTVIYTAHGFHFHPGGNPLKNTIFLTLEKLAGLWTDYLVVINHEDEQAAKCYQLVPPERVYYTPGIGVDLDHYSINTVSDTEVIQVRQELGLAQTNSLLLMIAEFIPRKRHRDLLKAFALSDRSEAHLAFAGDGPLEGEMQQLATELGVQNQVHFLSYRLDIPALIRASVATILPSEQEGLPRSIMESLCMETPVIGTDIRGIRDLLKASCGLLVKVGDVKGLANALSWMLDHPEEAHAMGKRGKVHMANYNLKHIIKLHETLYSQAMDERIDSDCLTK